MINRILRQVSGRSETQRTQSKSGDQILALNVLLRALRVLRGEKQVSIRSVDDQPTHKEELFFAYFAFFAAKILKERLPRRLLADCAAPGRRR